jgi:uncharacterized protein YbbC (DUF1343 family)
MMTPRVVTGLDRLAARRFDVLRGRRVGLIANPTTVDARMNHLADLLHEAPEVRLAALFGPEHGVRGEEQDMEGVGHDRDPATGVVVHSLYGDNEASLRPTSDQLDGLDVLVFDVQDVGSRYYTFAATMLYAMEAAAGLGLAFVVLDRPNPINGVDLEGPAVDPGYHSFVGAYPLPIRHGMTVGELARLFRAEKGLDLDLEVMPCEGWSRAMFWRETGLPWVAPSPNMPTPETALVYPGGCLIEGTNLSEGRGTTRPFELWGAPDLDPKALAEGATGDASRGAWLRPCSFRPMFHKHRGRVCHGVQPHVIDPSAFRSLGLYTTFLALARAQALDTFGWRTEAYEFIKEPIAIDLLYGSGIERSLIETAPADDWATGVVLRDALAPRWDGACRAFRERRRDVLLYPDGG